MDQRPIHDLVAMLLERLLQDLGGTGRATLTVTEGPDWPAITVDAGDRPPMGSPTWPHTVDLVSELADGVVRLDVTTGHGGSSGGQDRVRETALRYLPPIVTSIDLELRVQARQRQAAAAVEAVEGSALLDLATGIVMARNGGDPPAARKTLNAWSTRTGIRVEDLTATTMLELLTAEEL